MKHEGLGITEVHRLRWIRRAVAAGSTLAVLGVAIALAAPKQFNPGDPLSSADMNANFNELDTRVKALETTRPVVKRYGRSYSLDAVYCGKTAPTTGTFVSGSQVGYGAAKVQCESVCTSPSAHMCEAREMVRTMQLAQGTDAGASALPPDGWYSSGADYLVLGTTVSQDCTGWTSSNAGVAGPQWSILNTPTRTGCNASIPILCCD